MNRRTVVNGRRGATVGATAIGRGRTAAALEHGIRRGASALLLGVLLVASSADAHHSMAMFDDSRVIELDGTIKEFQWTNPHTWIQVIVEDENGQAVEWSIEGGGPNSLSRRGWRPTTFEPGAVVTIRTHPMRNGAPAGLFIGARFEDGSTIGRWEDGEAR